MWTFGVMLLIAGGASVAVHGKFITKNILPPTDELVVGGTNAPDGAVPYQASLRDSGGYIFYCGGSIVHKRWVLTAAHCTRQDPSIMSVVVGSNRLDQGGDKYDIDFYIKHKDSSKDISLIKLKSDIKFGPAVKVISLPEDDTAAGARVLLSGWGNIKHGGPAPNDLQWINLTTISVSDCRERLNASVYDTEICTLTKAGEGACIGDSGGPLVENGVLVGVASKAVPCAKGFPDVYTRVWSFKDWIVDQIEKEIDVKYKITNVQEFPLYPRKYHSQVGI